MTLIGSFPSYQISFMGGMGTVTISAAIVFYLMTDCSNTETNQVTDLAIS
jgi:hypothetical protein